VREMRRVYVGTRRKLSRFIVFALLLAAFSSACEPVTRVRGTVRDKNGTPVADVVITMYSSSEGPDEKKKESEQKTDPAGKFNFVSVTPGAKNVLLIFRKDGYVTVEKEITGNVQSDLDVVLEAVKN
jgi:hypothetical protein